MSENKARSALLDRIAEWLADAGPDIGPSHTVRDELVRRELEAVRLLKDCRLDLAAAGDRPPDDHPTVEEMHTACQVHIQAQQETGQKLNLAVTRMYQLETELAELKGHIAAGDRPSLQIDELFQELELALWNKIGNTWEATQGQRVNAFLRKYLRVAGDRPSLEHTLQVLREQQKADFDRAEKAEARVSQLESAMNPQDIPPYPEAAGDRPSLPEYPADYRAESCACGHDWGSHRAWAGNPQCRWCACVEYRAVAVGARPAQQEPDNKVPSWSQRIAGHRPSLTL